MALMRVIGVVLSLLAVSSLAMGQRHWVEGHISKSGKFVKGHWVKDRAPRSSSTSFNVPLATPSKHKPADEVAREEEAKGRHREHRYYPGHYAKDGHYIKPHWQWVWVKA